METAARGATTPTWMSAVLSMSPVYRSGPIGPPMLPDGRGPCDGWVGSLPHITDPIPRDGAEAGDVCRSARHPPSGRAPLLHRVDRGRYVRHREVRPGEAADAGLRLVLIGSSGATTAEPAPAARLFASP